MVIQLTVTACLIKFLIKLTILLYYSVLNGFCCLKSDSEFEFRQIQPTMEMASVICLFLLTLSALAGILYYIGSFVMVKYSSPNKDPEYDKWVRDVCAPTGILKTLLTVGYFKASLKIIFRHYKQFFLSIPVAELGKPAPDACVVDLCGNKKSLRNDYFANMQKSMPLILNFGSYT
jgi:hypothetical protein